MENTPAPQPAAPTALATDDAWPRDPAAYDWYPVLRKTRPDGWTPQAQRRFIEVLADTGSVMNAAEAVGHSRSSAYKLRRAPGAEGFAAAWAAAIDNASARALDECFERALVGSDEPVFDRDGNCVGRRLRQSDRLLMFIVRAYMPDRFRHATRDVRANAESPPSPIEPVANALARLDPAMPASPHALIAADELARRLDDADLFDGERPRAHRAGPPPPPVAMPLGEAFERGLADAKRATAGQPPFADDEWHRHRDRTIARAAGNSGGRAGGRADGQLGGHVGSGDAQEPACSGKVDTM